MIYKTMIYCSTCKKVSSDLMNANRAIQKDGSLTVQYKRCSECNNRIQKEKYHRNPKKMAQYVYKSIAKYPERQRARQNMHYHLNVGNISKPNRCDACFCQDKRIEAHHIDYSKPLNVQWLCTKCHKEADEKAIIIG